MNDPKRILDEEGGLAHALLSSAKDDAPSTNSRAKAMTALGIAGATATTAKAATAAKLLSLKWLGIALVPIAVGTTYLVSRSSPSPSPSPISSPVRSVEAPTPSTPPPVEPIAPIVSVSTAPKAPKLAPPKPPPATPATQGADEAALVDAAARAIKAGDKKTALSKLDEYDRRFKGGILEGAAKDLRAKAAKLP